MIGPIATKKSNDRSVNQELGMATRQSYQPVSYGLKTDILALQRDVGNQAVCQLLQTSEGHSGVIQTKLKVNRPGDRYEQEADRIADQVMRMPEPSVQQQMKPEAEEEEEMLQTKATSGQSPNVSAILPNRINALRGSGQPLPQSERAFFESRFGSDFSQVHVHADSQAAEMAASVNARAFTLGQDIVFGAGQYAPGTIKGKHLLAHELTHTIQQASMPEFSIQRAEVDEAATGIDCPTLRDGTAALNAEVNRRLTSVRTALTDRARAATPSLVGPPSISGSDMVEEAYNQLGAPYLPHLALIEQWSNSHLPHRGGGTGLNVITGTRYEHIPFRMRFIYGYLAPVVKLNGICVGTDKIGHMFQQGFQYYYISQRGRVAGTMTGLGRGDQYARAWGEWMEGELSPATRGNPAIMAWLRRMSRGAAGSVGIRGQRQGHFGLASTGVHSRGDLAANEAGMRFYRDLLGNPYMTFDINRYITPDWNEQVSGNIYSRTLGAAVRRSGRLGSRDVVRP